MDVESEKSYKHTNTQTNKQILSDLIIYFCNFALFKDIFCKFCDISGNLLEIFLVNKAIALGVNVFLLKPSLCNLFFCLFAGLVREGFQKKNH